jgi:hypothetical protein
MGRYRFVDQDSGYFEDFEFADDQSAIEEARIWNASWIDDSMLKEAAKDGRPVEARTIIYEGDRIVDEIVETFDPIYPDCVEDEHAWEAPYSLVGGIRENPGVFGHGGGVIMTEYCRHCGARRVVDTWAPDGHGGVTESESIVALDDLEPDEQNRVRAWLAQQR